MAPKYACGESLRMASFSLTRLYRSKFSLAKHGEAQTGDCRRYQAPDRDAPRQQPPRRQCEPSQFGLMASLIVQTQFEVLPALGFPPSLATAVKSQRTGVVDLRSLRCQSAVGSCQASWRERRVMEEETSQRGLPRRRGSHAREAIAMLRKRTTSRPPPLHFELRSVGTRTCAERWSMSNVLPLRINQPIGQCKFLALGMRPRR